MPGFPDFEAWWAQNKPDRSFVNAFDKWYTNNAPKVPLSPTRDELLAQVQSLRAQVQNLESQIIQKDDAIASLWAAVGERNQTIDALRGEVSQLKAQVATLQARIDELENPTEPTPEPVPSQSLVVPGTGAVLFEDLQTEPNPSKVYGAQSTPWYYGTAPNGQDDPFLPILTTNPCPHVPVGKSNPTPRYRRHISKPDVLSKGDEDSPNHTRTQTQKWSDSNNPAAFPSGKYVIYYSVRPAYDKLPNPVGSGGGGNERLTQLFQFKSHSGGSGTFLNISCSVGNDGISLISRNSRGDRVSQQVVSLPNRWNRLALVADWRDGGWFELWSDENGKMVKRTQRVTNATLLNGNPKFSIGLGPYHQMTLFNGTVSGQPRTDYWCDYTNIQVCRYTGN